MFINYMKFADRFKTHNHDHHDNICHPVHSVHVFCGKHTYWVKNNNPEVHNFWKKMTLEMRIYINSQTTHCLHCGTQSCPNKDSVYLKPAVQVQTPSPLQVP